MTSALNWARSVLFTITNNPEGSGLNDASESPVALWSRPDSEKNKIYAQLLVKATSTLLNRNALGTANGLWIITYKDDDCLYLGFPGAPVLLNSWRMQQEGLEEQTALKIRILGLLQPVVSTYKAKLDEVKSADEALGHCLRIEYGVANKTAFGWLWPPTIEEIVQTRITCGRFRNLGFPMRSCIVELLADATRGIGGANRTEDTDPWVTAASC